MSKKSEEIQRKFIKTKEVSDYEIWTDTGWKDISSISKTVKYEVWEIKTENHSLKCADTHILFDENMEEVYAKDLIPNKSRIATEDGFELVISAENLHFSDNMYDISVNDENHRYYTDGILSHNSTIYCIYTLWLTCFFPEKKVMILANKNSTALELMSRISLGYSYLPSWLKPSVLVNNKGELLFGNNSGIKSLASSSDAARGFSCNCLVGNTKITVVDDNGNIFETEISKVKEIKNSKLKVLTENGFKPFHGVRISKTKCLVDLVMDNGQELSCTPEHKLKLKDKLFVEARNLKIGIELSNRSKIVSIKERFVDDELVYDLIEVEGGHEYIANSFSVHNCVILDEFSFLPQNISDKLFTSIYPVVSSSKNGKVIIVSTPNGIGNMYYDIWRRANAKNQEENVDGWKPFTMWWWQIPGRDEKWKEQQIATIGKERFAQEFNNEFLSSSTFRKLLPDEVIEKHREFIEDNNKTKAVQGKILPILNLEKDNKKVYTFTMWHEIKAGHSYVAACDVAEGTGGDYSTLYIFDVTDLRKITMCAKFSDNMVTTNEFAFVVSKILSLYGNPPLIGERNGIGAAFFDILTYTYEYENCVQETPNGLPGIRSGYHSKNKACLWLKEMFVTTGFDWILYDMDLIDEMNTFVEKANKANSSFGALKGSHDDSIMSLIWAGWMLSPEIIEKYMIVTSSFRTSLNQIYPLTTKPMTEIDYQYVSEVMKDPIYRSYMNFKEEMIEKTKIANEHERLIEKNDYFNRLEQAKNSMLNPKQHDGLIDGSYGYGNGNQAIPQNNDYGYQRPYAGQEFNGFHRDAGMMGGNTGVGPSGTSFAILGPGGMISDYGIDPDDEWI